MKKILLLGMLTLVIASTLSAKGVKVVYDLKSGDAVKVEDYLRKTIQPVAQHYKDTKEEFKATVVISGEACKFFVLDLKNSPYASQPNAVKIHSLFIPLVMRLNDTYHISFKVCPSSSGMDKKQSEMKQSIELIEAQNKGYAYVPLH